MYSTSDLFRVDTMHSWHLFTSLSKSKVEMVLRGIFKILAY